MFFHGMMGNPYDDSSDDYGEASGSEHDMGSPSEEIEELKTQTGVKRPAEGFELPDTKKLKYSEDYASSSVYPFITFDLISSFCSDSILCVPSF
jgi:hypothetical protein